MSKTAKELTDEGKYDDAIALDRTYGRAYYLKGVDGLKKPNPDKAAALKLFETAKANGYEKNLIYMLLGDCYAHMGKNKEAAEAFEKHINKKPEDPANWEPYRNRGYVLISLSRIDEAVKCLIKADELNPKDAKIDGPLGLLYEEQGREDEAIKRYDTGISKNNTVSGYYKGRLLAKNKKYNDAIPILEQALEKTGAHGGGGVCLWLGKCHAALGDQAKAKTYYEKGLTYKPEISIEYCNRAQLHSMLGNKEQALQDIRKTKELLDTGKNSENLPPSTIKFMKDSIQLILEAEEQAAKTESLMKNFDPTNAVVVQVNAELKALEQQKEKAQGLLIEQLDNKQASDGADNMKNIIEQMNEKIRKLEEEQQKTNAKVDNLEKQMITIGNKIVAMEDRMAAMEEDLSNMMRDYEKSLESDLKKADVSQDDTETLLKYFRAFVGTFGSAHTTAIVVSSGKVQLNASSSGTTLLSMLASFSPFCGSALSSGIKSIGEFLKSRDMINNANKVLGLATDAAKLSQLMGEIGKKIVLDKKKQEQILKTTEEDLREVSGNLFKKVSQIMKNLSQDINAMLYINLYETPAQRVGHNDANDLIAYWINECESSPFGYKDKFVKIILDRAKEEKKPGPAPGDTIVKSTGRSACCNLF